MSNGSGTRLFHPGDSYAIVPENVTALAVPVVGPWGSLQEAVDFADAVAPEVMFPIHDVHLSETGNELFWPWLKNLSSSEVEGIDAAPGETITIA